MLSRLDESEPVSETSGSISSMFSSLSERKFFARATAQATATDPMTLAPENAAVTDIANAAAATNVAPVAAPTVAAAPSAEEDVADEDKFAARRLSIANVVLRRGTLEPLEKIQK